MRTVHVVLPEGVDDPRRPSGGNVYDRRVCRGLADLGWTVPEHAVPGRWPETDAAARSRLDGVLVCVPDDELVLVDGLVACAAGDLVAAHAERLRVVVLVHMLLGADGAPDDVRAREGAALSAAHAVVTTSRWTRGQLLARYEVPGARVHVAEPGADRAPPAPGTAAGGELLCVAAVTAAKGHDTLLAALATLGDLPWRCTCAGSLDVAPAFARGLRRRAEAQGVAGRVHFTGPLSGGELDDAYARSDLLVLPSHAETYAMVVVEALAHGLPVVATDVGGVPEALGRVGGTRPGVLVPIDDPAAVAGALRDWLADPGQRQRLRAAARGRRRVLSSWRRTALRVSGVLSTVASEPPRPAHRVPR